MENQALAQEVKEPSAAKTSPLVSLERSLSSDLVSLSSTSGSEASYDQSQRGVTHEEADSRSAATLDVSQGLLADSSAASGSRQQLDIPTPQRSHTSSLTPSEQDVSSETDESQLGSNPLQYHVLDREKLAPTEYESSGLLFARSSNASHDV